MRAIIGFNSANHGDIWKDVSIGNLGEIITGTTPDTRNEEFYDNNGCLFITPTDINSKYTKTTLKKLSKAGLRAGRRVPAGSILITCIASIGKNTIILEEGSCNQQINAIVPNKEKFCPEFVYYLMEYNHKKIISNASKGNMLIINKSIFSSINVFAPSLPEQQKIAEFFSTFDERIRVQEELIAALEKMKKGYMQQLFPQDGETEPRMRFEEFVGSGEWEEVRLGDVCQIDKGSQLNRLKMNPNGAYYVLNGGISPSGRHTEFNTPENTISISSGGASAGYISFNKEKFWAGGDLFVLNNLINTLPLFLFYSLKKEEKAIMKCQIGGGIPHIYKKDLTLRNIFIPCIPEQQKIADFLSALDQKIEIQKKTLDVIKEMKKGYMQRMFV